MIKVTKDGKVYSNGKEIKPYFNQKWRVSYRDDNNNVCNASVDVLVAKEFLGFKKGDCVIHKNGDIKDCQVDNLLVCKRSEQIGMLYRIIRGEIK